MKKKIFAISDVHGHYKEMINALRKLANMVYPLIISNGNANKAKYNNPKYNKYATNTFSNDVNKSGGSAQ